MMIGHYDQLTMDRLKAGRRIGRLKRRTCHYSLNNRTNLDKTPLHGMDVSGVVFTNLV